MVRPLRSVLDGLDDRMVALVSTLGTLLGLILAVYAEFKSAFPIILLCFSGAIFAGTAIYSVRVREELLALQGAATCLHEINHTYRDILTTVFDSRDPLSTEARMQMEQHTLQIVCQRIGEIYKALLTRPCTITIKVVDQDRGWHCRTYARSEPRSRRDQANLLRFNIGTGENTGFDVAMQPHPGGGISHFFSSDLRALRAKNQYRNQRDDWERYYRSTLIVPIRYYDYGHPPGGAPHGAIGFLCVDTLSVNHLNNGHHLQLLASLADQIYNFSSLMRGKYRLPLTQPTALQA